MSISNNNNPYISKQSAQVNNTNNTKFGLNPKDIQPKSILDEGADEFVPSSQDNFEGARINENSDKNDPLINSPLRYIAYSNDVGAAVAGIPVIGAKLNALFQIPVFLYVGADIMDKYLRGDNDDYKDPSMQRALSEAGFQLFASILLPPLAVSTVQNVTSKCFNLNEKSLDLRAQQEVFEFMKKKIGSGTNQFDADKIKNIDANEFFNEFYTNMKNVDTTTTGSKISRFFSYFSHSHCNPDKPVNAAFSKQQQVQNFANTQLEKLKGLDTSTATDRTKALCNSVTNKSLLKSMIPVAIGFATLACVVGAIDKFSEEVIMKKGIDPILDKIFGKEKKNSDTTASNQQVDTIITNDVFTRNNEFIPESTLDDISENVKEDFISLPIENIEVENDEKSDQDIIDSRFTTDIEEYNKTE